MNPRAGRGISEPRIRRLSNLLGSASIDHRILVTESREHLIDAAFSAASRGYAGIVAHGGDGTANHAATGIIRGKSSIPLTICPGGNGNDWARHLGIRKVSDTIESIRKRKNIILDAAECLIRDEGGRNIHSCIFVNSAGIGLDAHVLARAVRARERFPMGRTAYILSLVSTAAEMPWWEGTLTADGSEVFTGNYLSLTVGVCPYTGGGMMLSPSSRPDDDALDLALVRPISRWKLIRSMPMAYSGNLLEHPSVSSWRSREFQFRAHGAVIVELDGEGIPDIPENASIVLKSIPSAITVLGNTQN